MSHWAANTEGVTGSVHAAASVTQPGRKRVPSPPPGVAPAAPARKSAPAAAWASAAPAAPWRPHPPPTRAGASPLLPGTPGARGQSQSEGNGGTCDQATRQARSPSAASGNRVLIDDEDGPGRHHADGDAVALPGQ